MRGHDGLRRSGGDGGRERQQLAAAHHLRRSASHDGRPDVAVLRAVSPWPGKCLTQAATPVSWSPKQYDPSGTPLVPVVLLIICGMNSNKLSLQMR